MMDLEVRVKMPRGRWSSWRRPAQTQPGVRATLSDTTVRYVRVEYSHCTYEWRRA